MVDRDVLLRKAGHAEHHIARLMQRLPVDAETLQADEDLRNLVVHQYGDLLMDRVATALNHDLGDLRSFVGCLRDHARR